MILITGGMGFIGCNLARYLVDHGQEVLLTYHSRWQVPSFLEASMGKGVKAVSCDIGDLPNLMWMVREHGVTSIIHAAATNEGKGTFYQTYKVNMEGTVHVLEAARVAGLKRITFLSTVTVYNREETGPYMEDEPIAVESRHYISATKKAGEIISHFYGKEYGLELIIARVSAVYGPLYITGRHPILKMVQSAVDGKPAELPDVLSGDGNDFMYVKDCARALGKLHLAEVLQHSIYNVGSGRASTFAEVAETVKSVVPGSEITLGRGKSRGASCMDISRINQELGFTPEYDLRSGVAAFVDWLKNEKY